MRKEASDRAKQGPGRVRAHPGASIRIHTHPGASGRIRAHPYALIRSRALSGAQASFLTQDPGEKKIPKFLTRRGIPGNPGSADFAMPGHAWLVATCIQYPGSCYMWEIFTLAGAKRDRAAGQVALQVIFNSFQQVRNAGVSPKAAFWASARLTKIATKLNSLFAV